MSQFRTSSSDPIQFSLSRRTGYNEHHHITKARLCVYHQITTAMHDRCTSGFSGTSASAPMAASMVALMLEVK